MAKEQKTRSDITLEGNKATWTIKSLGDINGLYLGTFVFKTYLNPMEQIRANRDFRELMGPNPSSAPEHESFLAYALTQLKHRIISAPPFWNSARFENMEGNIPDEGVITDILGAATDAEVLYRKQLKKMKKDSITMARQAAEEMIKRKEEETLDEEEDEEGEDDES